MRKTATGDGARRLNEATLRSMMIGCHIPEYKAKIAALEKEKAQEFIRGYLMAAAHVMRTFDQPGIAFDLMGAVGVTTRRECIASGLEGYDLKQLHRILKQENR